MECLEKETLPTIDLLESLNGKMQNLCRACLGSADPPSPLFSENGSQESLAYLVWTCTGIRPTERDGLPKSLCSKCCTNLSIANRFRLLVQQTDNLLQQYAGVDIKLDTEFIKQDSELCVLKSENLESESNSSNMEVSEVKIEVDEMSSNDTVDEDQDEENLVEDVGKVNCKICGRPLGNKYSLKKHMKRCQKNKDESSIKASGWGRDRRYHCPECPYKSYHKKSIVQHFRLHTGEKPYKCNECDKCFAQQSTLTSHKKTHSDKMYYTCAECGRQFKHKSKYELHRKYVHIDEKNFPCTLCDKKLKTKATLEIHMNRHNNIRNFNCETCGATFVTRVDLTNHNRIHSIEKKHACHLCEYTTNIKKALDSHLKRHSGERPFKCGMCEWSCFTRGELKCHMRKHTKEKNYACPVCKMKFGYSPCVNKHMLTEHGIKYKWADGIDRRVIK